jgi:hypothetical protein
MPASLLVLATVLSLPAFAQEGEDSTDAASEADEPKQKSEGGLSMEGPYAKKPYAKPVIGAMIWDGAYGVSLGAEAGLNYQQEKNDPVMFGKTRVRGAYTIGAGISGYDVRLGSFFGPFHKVVGIQAGPDVFYNQLSVEVVGGEAELFATPGMDFPITGLFDVKVFDAYVGVSPGWYFSGERENLNGAMGQLSYYMGAGLNLSKLRLNLGWSRTMTAYGDQDGFSVGVGI